MSQLIRFQKIGETKVYSEVTSKPLVVVINILKKHGYHVIQSVEYSEGDTVKLITLRR